MLKLLIILFQKQDHKNTVICTFLQSLILSSQFCKFYPD